MAAAAAVHRFEDVMRAVCAELAHAEMDQAQLVEAQQQQQLQQQEGTRLDIAAAMERYGSTVRNEFISLVENVRSAAPCPAAYAAEAACITFCCSEQSSCIHT